MAGICSLVDLLLFYTPERVLFNRMVCTMGKTTQLVKKAMALWIMLEEIGYHDLIRMMHSYNDNTIEALFDEALQCLECIQPTATEPAETHDTPVFRGLLDEPMNRRFFYYHRDFMYKRYLYVMQTVCDKIFGETAAIEVDESGRRPVALGRGMEAAEQSNLNPDATEFYPGQTPEDTRTMFLTFSMGRPLSREEIVNFFTSKWGDVVQDVFIENTCQGQHPQFGRIVFSSSLVIAKVLNGQNKAKFMVNRKHLWARVYVPRQRGRRNQSYMV